MKAKKVIVLFVVCIIAIGSLVSIADAENLYEEPIVQMEDMCCERVDMSQIQYFENAILPRTTYSISDNILTHAIHISNEKIALVPRQIVTINCSYSPAVASVDFGVIAPDGYFYFLNVEGGSINRSIRVNQSGDYAVAIRNNFSNTISVVGFISY